MKIFFAIAFLFISFSFALGQNEQSPIVEKQIDYKNWTYKDIRSDKDINLRDFAAGKKLVIVVYFAPWCPNWKHDAPFLQRFYDKYKAKGLDIIAVGEYDSVAAMKTNLDALKITFPAVYESESRDAREKTLHFDYRKVTGDARKWGSPWYLLLTAAAIEKKGDVLTHKTFVINGEMIEAEGEKFIREKLGLPREDVKAAASGKIEACEPDKKIADLKQP